MLDIKPDALCNFNKTYIFFNPAPPFTLNVKGAKTVTVQHAKLSQRCTAMLGVCCDNFKFPPYVIFKGSTGKSGRILKAMKALHTVQLATHPALLPVNKHNRFLLANLYNVQPKGWMNEASMLEWVELVLKPWAETKAGVSMVILDKFKGHMTPAVQLAIANCCTQLEFIPPRYTGCLQVLDVGINKPFKDWVCDSFDKWYIAHPNKNPLEPTSPIGCRQHGLLGPQGNKKHLEEGWSPWQVERNSGRV